MIAKALEHNGATVYIVGRRADVIEQAAAEHNVRPRSLALRALAPRDTLEGELTLWRLRARITLYSAGGTSSLSRATSRAASPCSPSRTPSGSGTGT